MPSTEIEKVILGGRFEGEDQLFSFGCNEFEKSFDHPNRDVELTVGNESGIWRSDLAWTFDYGSHRPTRGISSYET